ncbi:hypothetical protein PMIN01_09826 [Paraphaeosphaeria minitans]|uniref:Uncharacterized protein n=1 Tax=Paraphaeosphaeria minitans TaxID=565426 RepID=A0A9P6GA10_9PLEO|nr:hypothetical protein PMIN01_09826 [Paraphaeosphaeria minitans]
MPSSFLSCRAGFILRWSQHGRRGRSPIQRLAPLARGATPMPCMFHLPQGTAIFNVLPPFENTQPMPRNPISQGRPYDSSHAWQNLLYAPVHSNPSPHVQVEFLKSMTD